MKKYVSRLSTFFSAVVICCAAILCGGCSGGGDGASTQAAVGTSKVSLSIGKQVDLAATVIPPEVKSLEFTISAQDIKNPVPRRIAITDYSRQVVESFIIPNGQNRQFLVEAFDDVQGGNVLYRGIANADLNGTEKSISLTLQSLPSTVTGLVTNATTGQGIDGVTVTFTTGSGSNSTTVNTTNGGSYTVSLSAETYNYVASKTAYISMPSTSFTVTASAKPQSLNIKLNDLALASIVIAPPTPIISVGAPAPQQFTATGTYTDKSTKDLTASVTWKSSNTSVATIAADGKATAVQEGASTITASSGAIVGSTSLTVPAVPLIALTIEPPNSYLAVGSLPLQFKATGTFSDKKTKDLTASVTWKSSDTSVATIATDGKATAVPGKGGSTTISAVSGGIEGATKLTVSQACGGPVEAKGGYIPDVKTYFIGANKGSFQFSYETYTEPDQIVITYGNSSKPLWETPGANKCEATGVTGNKKVITLSVDGSASEITVTVIPNCGIAGGGLTTQWTYTVNCLSSTNN